MKNLTGKSKGITQWSFSRWETWSTCALKAMYKYVAKLDDPSGEAALRGTEVGDSVEGWLAGTIRKLPAEAAGIKTEVTRIRKLKPRIQLEWALDDKWQPTGWFADNTWCRIKTDVVAENKKEKLIEVHDGKTGRIKEIHNLQLSLYAIGAFAHFPAYDTVRVQLLYYDHNKTLPEDGGKVYDRSELKELQGDWLGRVALMLRDKVFAPTKGDHCRWCTYSRKRGGPCPVA
jgi:CRISPR/Cas system-associated exonuclease Cas4 (RecB family)